jgi:hypothetical protein
MGGESPEPAGAAGVEAAETRIDSLRSELAYLHFMQRQFNQLRVRQSDLMQSQGTERGGARGGRPTP